MIRPFFVALLGAIMLVSPAAFADEQVDPVPPVQVEPEPEPEPEPAPEPAPDPMEGVDIPELRVAGVIDNENISFDIAFDVETAKLNREFPLIRGDVVMRELTKPDDGYKLSYQVTEGAYTIGFAAIGTRRVEASFAVRPRRIGNGEWREARFALPASQVRRLSVQCDRTDLEVEFPDAMRVERTVVGETLTLTAILGPGKPFVVRWKPQVQALDAKLIASVEANTVATVSAGALRQDTLMIVDIAQGKLSELTFKVPKGVSITQVRGNFIRDWSLTGQGDARRLTVVLNREQDTRYALQLLTESLLPAFPTTVDLPVIEPVGLHMRGHLTVGTNSAIALLIDKTSGLSQIDNAAFPRVVLGHGQDRRPPAGKAFSYNFAAVPYAMSLSLSNIVPSYDVQHSIAAHLREDDLVLNAQMTIDVRDAPVRSLTIKTPAAYNVANVVGALIEDFRVLSPAEPGGPKRVEVQFNKPLIGSSAIAMQLELGRGPLGQEQKITAPSVEGAKTQRGHLVVSVEQGVRIDHAAASDDEALKRVHIGSVTMQVPDAQYAYRFRGMDWSLSLRGSRREAGMAVEAFHLHSISDGIAFGTVVFNYFITGSPIDELKFVAPSSLKAIEFVGRDIARTSRDGDVWTVKLNRKVIGDYNLAVTYNQPWEDGGKVRIASVHADGIERQNGYVMVTSHLNLKITAAKQAEASGALLAIDRDEVPSNYRLLAYSPILRNFMYAAEPQPLDLTIEAFDRADLLDVVVEFVDIESSLSVRDDGETESITKVRYHVKNTSRQFMEVTLPAGARVMRVERVSLPKRGQVGSPQRLAAARDPADPLKLQIPLGRNINPNEPILIDLEYSQQHGTLGWSGELTLDAPRTPVASTFADWHVEVPADWSIHPAGGNMVSSSGAGERLGLAWVGTRVLDAWRSAIDNHLFSGLTIAVAVIIVLIGALLAIFLPRYLGDWAVIGLLGFVTMFGVVAMKQMVPLNPDQLPTRNAATFEQAVMVDAATPLTVRLNVVPDWREHMSTIGGVVVPILVVVALLGALVLRRPRPVLISAAIVGAVFAAAQFPDAAMYIGHALTWGVPALLLTCFVLRVVLWPLLTSRGGAQAAAAAVLIGAGLFSSGCIETIVDFPIVEGPVLERVTAGLTAESDSMTVQLDFKVSADEPMEFTVLDQRAVLLSTDQPHESVRIERRGERYVVNVLKAGTYTCQTRWVTPLAEADDDQVQRFEMPLPIALSNDVKLTVPRNEMEIFAPSAVRLTSEKAANATTAEAVFGPTDPVRFVWRPRARQLSEEKTLYYATATSAYKFDAGLVEGRHTVAFQIAQGVLKDIRLKLPAGLSVTSVEGANLGAWRYEPNEHTLEVRLGRAVAGEYALKLLTQRSIDKLPHDTAVGPIGVLGAARARATVGLVTSPLVYIETSYHAGTVNVDDFARDAAGLLKQLGNVGPVRHAFRMTEGGASIPVAVNAVKPELRAFEQTQFDVADDRLVYKGPVTIDIAKAGRFSAELRVPAAYDIDTLGAPQVSHWDERVEGDVRRITVHFRQQLLGRVTLQMQLSQPVSALPQRLVVPRVEVVGALKHTGQVVITSDRGVSLTVDSRGGVSELNIKDMGINRPGTLAYKLLRPDWGLTLRTEVIEPLITANFLHIADVSEGVVQHTQYVRYRLQNAGTKFFDVRLPEGAAAVRITGSEIARREKIADDQFRVELNRKWFDRPYMLTIKYETRFDRGGGAIAVKPVIALGTDRQRGHIAVLKSERIGLQVAGDVGALRPADARNIHSYFNSNRLASAVYCYSSNTPDFTLNLRAERLTAAKQLDAEVEETAITTVITDYGQSVNTVKMRLSVGTKRLLATRLPAGSKLWSVSVNGQSVAPSQATDAGERVLLIPLAQASMGDLPVLVELVYVFDGAVERWSGRLSLPGPRFDLPLKDITWELYAPDGYEYDAFTGTLSIREQTLSDPVVQRYDSDRYNRQVEVTNTTNDEQAKQLQQRAREFAAKGQQYEARQALYNGRNFSQQDLDLNEDIRVDLNNLLRQQANVGLIGTRDRLRNQNAMGASNDNNLGDEYKEADAKRVLNTLGKDDAENLDAISQRLIEVQEQAAGQLSQLSIVMPTRGRKLAFTRPLQVEESAPMEVSFDVARPWSSKVTGAGIWAAGLFGVLAVVFGLGSFAAGRWDAVRRGLTRERRSPEQQADDNLRDEIAADPTDDEEIANA